MRFRSLKERGTRVKERSGEGVGKKERNPLPPPPSFFGSCFISRAIKTENPLPRSLFAPKPNGNACYTGYTETANQTLENISTDITLLALLSSCR